MAANVGTGGFAATGRGGGMSDSADLAVVGFPYGFDMQTEI
jgi:hypothetical protein